MAGEIPRLPDMLANWVDASGRPTTDFFLWAEANDVQIRVLLGLIEGVEGDLGALKIKDVQAHTIAKVKNVTARFHFIAEWAGTINSTKTDCQAGTATVRWQINGTNVGTQTNSISASAQTRTHTTANTFAAGDVITYTITSASSCTEALLQCNITRNPT